MDETDFGTITEHELADYDRLVSAHGTLFQRRDWLAAVGARCTFFAFRDSGGRVVAAAPVPEKKMYGMRTVMRPDLTPHVGPVMEPVQRSYTGELEFRRMLLTELVNYLERLETSLCLLSLAPGFEDCLPFRWAHYKVVPNYTYRLDLNSDEESLWAGLTSTRRRNIRAATRDRLEIAQITDYTIVQTLVEKTFQRRGKKLSPEVVQRVLYSFSHPGNSFAIAALRHGVPVAVTYIAHDDRTAYYLLGGYDAEQGHHGAGAACMFRAITTAKARGLEVFDFEGSNLREIEKYFRGFGGRLVTYFGVHKAKLPLEILLKFRYRDRF